MIRNLPTGVAVKHFCWSGFGVTSTLEQWRSPDKTNVVVPQHSVDMIVPGNLECVLEDCFVLDV